MSAVASDRAVRAARRGRARGGFSLIELALALTVVALGMILLFGLFPAGLREGENAVSDTHCGFFADYVLAGFRSKASTIETWREWNNAAVFRARVVADMPGVAHTGDVVSSPVEFPPASGTYVRYILNIGPETTNAMLRTADLWIWSGRFVPTDTATFKRKCSWFYTEAYYPGKK